MEGLLALAGEDRLLTVSTTDGDTRREIELHGEPSDIQFSEMKMDQRVGGENTVNIFAVFKIYLFCIDLKVEHSY